MKTALVEVRGGPFWGKFLVGQFDSEWTHKSVVEPDCGLLSITGKSPDMLLVVDLETREGAIFSPHGCAPADLKKHPIRVCPLFLPLLEWLYVNFRSIELLPPLVELPGSFA